MYHGEDGIERGADVAASLAGAAAAAGEEPLPVAVLNTAEGAPGAEELRKYAAVLFFLVDRYPLHAGPLLAALEGYVWEGGGLVVCPFGFEFGRGGREATALMEALTGLRADGEAAARSPSGRGRLGGRPAHPALAAAVRDGLDAGPKGFRARLEELPGRACWRAGATAACCSPSAPPGPRRRPRPLREPLPLLRRLFPETCWRGGGGPSCGRPAARGPGGEAGPTGAPTARSASPPSAGPAPARAPHPALLRPRARGPGPAGLDVDEGPRGAARPIGPPALERACCSWHGLQPHDIKRVASVDIVPAAARANASAPAEAGAAAEARRTVALLKI
eukprot:tig00001234_g7746.t1